ncbi:MAG: PAS domain S-box protein [Planctomycetota bacterium]
MTQNPAAAPGPQPEPVDENTIRAILEMAVEAIITIDHRGLILTFNPAAERIFGYTAAEVQGRNISMLMPSPLREEHDGYLESYLRTHVAKIIGIGRETIGLRKDGTTFPIELAVSEIRREADTIFCGTIRDITERKDGERKLRRERDFSRAVLATTGGLVVLLDTEGRIIRFNRACEELTGYSEQEVLGRKPWDFLIERGEATDVEHVFEALRGGDSPLRYENHWVARNGKSSLIAWSNTTMVDDQDNVEVVIATGIDISQQRRAERNSAQHEKLAAVGQLAAGIAHEIGNPLNSISAVTQTVLRKTDDALVHEKLNLVNRHIERISTIVRQTMDFARPPRDEWKTMAVNTIVSDVLDIVKYDKRAKRADLKITLGDDLPEIRTMPDLLGQVFVNIALNGLDALESLPDDAAKRELRVSTAANDDWVRIVFEDTGLGIPRQVESRILDPFFTTKDVGKGTGMGLAVSYRTVKEHGGEILVEGRPGEGARFTVLLPVSREK